MELSLHPTLWRTCRTLAHRRRLKILAAVCEEKRATVGRIARRVSLPPAKTSLLLRQLQARGLIGVRRRGRWVDYEPTPDPSVPHAAALLHAILPMLPHESEYGRAISTLTAFTHPRRLCLLRALAEGPQSPSALRGRCALSYPALFRHLRKLMRRGFVQKPAGLYSLSPLRDPLSQALLTLSLAFEEDRAGRPSVTAPPSP